MKPEEIENLIISKLPNSKVQVSSPDGCHFDAKVISKDFAGKSLLERQRLVYKTINQEIADGSIHALSLKTYTPNEEVSRHE